MIYKGAINNYWKSRGTIKEQVDTAVTLKIKPVTLLHDTVHCAQFDV